MRMSDGSSDVCSSDLGYGVRLVRGPAELGAYLEGFPAGEAFILQDYVDWQGEAGVLYVRLPGEPAGRIFSLGFRSFPHVVGDGRSTLAELIATDPRTSRMARGQDRQSTRLNSTHKSPSRIPPSALK